MLDMRPTQPPHIQPVWSLNRDCLPGESCLYRYCGGGRFASSQGRIIDTFGNLINQNCNEPLSQLLLHQIMDNQSLYQHALDSGDDTCSLNDYFPESISMVGTGLQNIRGQTTAQPVSLANCGRDVGPSHPQYSNKAAPGNEQMFFPNHPAANAYTHDLAGSFNQQQFHYSSYSPSGLCNPNIGINFHHGLPPSNELYSAMPVFAEPFEYNHVSPTVLNGSFSSSAGSSIASERMASMTLNSGPQDSLPLMEFTNNHHTPSAGIQEQSWVGNCPATISPKMLRINPSPTPTSSSESAQTGQTGITATGGDSELGACAWDQQQTRNVHTKRSDNKTRKELPTKPAKLRLASASPPEESVTSKGKGKARVRQHNHQSPLRCLTEPTLARATQKHHPAVPEVDDPAGTVPSSSADAERDAKNRFLVESKLAGMTYREIRLQGGFTEAESTLRGRFRTLTKNKEQRVRKPEWQEKDIRLLKKAVRKLAKDDGSWARVPWKKVAAYIYEHGGSYHFGNATCRKKWDELVEQGVAGLP